MAGETGRTDRFANWMGGRESRTNPDNTQQPNGGGNGGGNDPTKQNVTQNVGDNVSKEVEDIWKADEKKAADPGPAAAAAPPAVVETLDVQVANHLKAQGLGDLGLTDAEITAFKDGNNVKEVLEKVNSRIQTGYMKAIDAASKLIDKRVEKAVETALGKSKEYIEGKELRSMLQTKLPYTKDPAVGPIAETVFKQFLEKGASREKALDLTDRFFKRTSALVEPENQSNRNFNGSHRGSIPQGDADWLKQLTGEES